MFCVKCGAKNNDNARFCEKCGNKINSESSSRKNISTPYYQDYVLSSWKTNPVRKLSMRIKAESIVYLIVAIILSILEIYSVYWVIFSIPAMLLDNHITETIILISILVLSIPILFLLIIINNFHIFFTLRGYCVDILSTPVNILNHYKSYNKRKISKPIIIFFIIITGLLIKLMTLDPLSFMAFFPIYLFIIIINIFPIAFTLINKNYVLNNPQVFNQIDSNYSENKKADEEY